MSENSTENTAPNTPSRPDDNRGEVVDAPNENEVGDNSVNQPNTPGQQENAGGVVESTIVTATAPAAEPQGSEFPEVQGAIDQVQAVQDVADQRGHYGVRPDPRPASDYSVEGSVARAEAGDTTSLPQADDTTRTHQP